MTNAHLRGAAVTPDPNSSPRNSSSLTEEQKSQLELAESAVRAFVGDGRSLGSYSALISAAVDGENPSMIRGLLLKAKKEYRLGSISITSFLDIAVKKDQTDIVAALLSAGSNMTSVVVMAQLLLYACESNKPDMVKALLEGGANPNVIVDVNKSAILHRAAWLCNTYDVPELLLEYGANPYALDIAGRSSLHAAAVNPNKIASKKIIGLLLGKAGVNPNIKNTLGQTALDLAVNRSSFVPAALLISLGANIDLCLDSTKAEIQKSLFDVALNTNPSDIDANNLFLWAMCIHRYEQSQYGKLHPLNKKELDVVKPIFEILRGKLAAPNFDKSKIKKIFENNNEIKDSLLKRLALEASDDSVTKGPVVSGASSAEGDVVSALQGGNSDSQQGGADITQERSAKRQKIDDQCKGHVMSGAFSAEDDIAFTLLQMRGDDLDPQQRGGASENRGTKRARTDETDLEDGGLVDQEGRDVDGEVGVEGDGALKSGAESSADDPS